MGHHTQAPHINKADQPGGLKAAEADMCPTAFTEKWTHTPHLKETAHGRVLKGGIGAKTACAQCCVQCAAIRHNNVATLPQRMPCGMSYWHLQHPD